MVHRIRFRVPSARTRRKLGPGTLGFLLVPLLFLAFAIPASGSTVATVNSTLAQPNVSAVTVPIPAAYNSASGIPAGHGLIVWGKTSATSKVCGAPACIMKVTDSEGNSGYTTVQTTNDAGNGVDTFLAAGPITTALKGNGSDSVTCHFYKNDGVTPVSGTSHCRVFDMSAMPSASFVDSSASLASYGTNLTAGALTVTTGNTDILFAIWSVGPSPTSQTPGAGFTQVLASNVPTGGSQYAEYAQATSGATPKMTIGPNESWYGIGVALKEPPSTTQVFITTTGGTTGAAVNFGSYTIGATSPAQPVLLTNQLSSSVPLAAASAAGDFAVATNTCGATLGAGATCSMGITFSPTVVGARTGTLSIPYTGTGSPITVALTGTGNANGLTAITVAPSNPSVLVSGTVQFTATGTFSSGGPQNLTASVVWTSSATGVATISNASGMQGLASSLAPGTSTITAALNSISGSTTLTVTAPPLVSIAVTPANPSIQAGANQQFTASGTYSDGSQQNITTSVNWSSSASAVATISNSSGSQGLAKGTGQGTAAITASLNSVTGSTLLTVTPPVLVSIAVTPSNPAIPAGSNEQFTATGTYSDSSQQNLTSSVTWSSSSTNVATINGLGLASSSAPGSTTIGAALNSIAGSTTLTVNPASSGNATVAAVNATLAQPNVSAVTVPIPAAYNSASGIPAGHGLIVWGKTSATSTVCGAPACIMKVTDSKGNSGYTTVQTTNDAGNGVDTFLAAGPITTALNGNGSDSVTCHFYKNDGVTPISGTGHCRVFDMSAMVSTAFVDSSASVAGYGTALTAGALTVTTGNTDILFAIWSVGPSPASQTPGAGFTQVLASNVPTGGSQYAEYAQATTGATPKMTISPNESWYGIGVALKEPPAALPVSVTVAPANPTISLGYGQQFTATANYPNGTMLDVTSGATWVSSLTSVATISNSGATTSTGSGSTTITATFNGVSGSTTLTVTGPALISIAVAPPNPSINAGTTQQFTATGSYSDMSTQNLTSAAQWSSSLLSVATIAPGGLATGITAGSATISASLGGISGSATLNVLPVVVTALSFNPSTVGSAQITTGTVTLSGTAPAGGFSVSLSSSNSSAFPVPASVTVPANTNSQTFQGTAGSVSGSTPVTVTATTGSTSVQANVTVAPPSGQCNNTSLGGGWICIGGNDDFGQNCCGSGPNTFTLSLPGPINAGDLLVFCYDAEGPGAISNVVTLTDNAGTGNTWTQYPPGPQLDAIDLPNGSYSCWYVLNSKAKSSGYVVSYADNGAGNRYHDAAVGQFRNTGGPSPGIDTTYGIGTGGTVSIEYSSGSPTTSAGPCPCDAPPLTISTAYDNELIVSAQNMSGIEETVTPGWYGVDFNSQCPFSLVPFCIFSVTTQATAGPISFQWATKTPSIPYFSTLMAFRPPAGGGSAANKGVEGDSTPASTSTPAGATASPVVQAPAQAPASGVKGRPTPQR